MNNKEQKVETSTEAAIDGNTVLAAVNFAEWLVELLPPEYDMDVRHRFTPQVKVNQSEDLVWIETHKHSINPKFYTTKELYERWLSDCR